MLVFSMRYRCAVVEGCVMCNDRSKFMLAGRRNFDELRVNCSELKLPGEMDFKFK